MSSINIVTHHSQKRIAVSFPYDEKKKQRIKEIAGSIWNKEMHSWLLPYSAENEILARQILSPPRKKTDDDPLFSTDEFRKFLKHLEVRRIAQNSIDTYTDAIKLFLRYFKDKPVTSITTDDILTFLHKKLAERNLSISWQRTMTTAIKHFYEINFNRDINFDKIPLPKKDQKLPPVLSLDEIKSLLSGIRNRKHKSILALMYGCGLRRGEVLKLLPTDINSARGLVIIRMAKGRKDRVTPLPLKVLELLREYYKIYRPKKWLFEGAIEGQQYSAKSMEMILKAAVERAGINKPVTLHWLRHSFATHQLEGGLELRYLQEILGHKSSRTTEIYTHVSAKSIAAIKSPIDGMDI